MGRLTLNVLLSFAQFEREVTGERIRDKIAQSKAKGMWMGGNVPLGYDARDRTLVVNESEAATVRLVFEQYLAIGSVHGLKEQLEAQGVRSKGGIVLSRGALFHLLRNQVYLGKIVHKGAAHAGLHPAIIDPDVFNAAQANLDANVVARARPTRAASTSPLSGLIFDQTGEPMCPSFSLGRGGASYRYYVSSAVITGRPTAAHAIRRVPAISIEDFVLGRLRQVDPTIDEAADPQGILATRIQRVSLGSGSVLIEIKFKAEQVRDRQDRRAILDRAHLEDHLEFDELR